MYRYASTQQSKVNPSPCFSPSHHPIPFYTSQSLYLLTWRTSFSCSWCEYPSTLVPGLLSTVLPLLLHPPQGALQIKLHIYIDDINNISRPIWYNDHKLTSISPAVWQLVGGGWTDRTLQGVDVWAYWETNPAKGAMPGIIFSWGGPYQQVTEVFHHCMHICL
jgi:hypothetical protein